MSSDEWQREPGPFGKRYRLYRNAYGILCKEYEMTVSTSRGGTIPVSQVKDFYENEKSAELKRCEEQNKQSETRIKRGNCPFKDGVSLVCNGDECALYVNGICALSRLADKPPLKDTAGLQCPLSRLHAKCNKNCALYVAGCALTGIKIESEDKYE